MKYCTKCGQELNDDAKFCTKCGAEQKEESEVVSTEVVDNTAEAKPVVVQKSNSIPSSVIYAFVASLVALTVSLGSAKFWYPQFINLGLAISAIPIGAKYRDKQKLALAALILGIIGTISSAISILIGIIGLFYK